MNSACLTTAYLAPVSYYSILYHYPDIEIEANCNYIKQTYRNRCRIVGANGVLSLTVPIVKPDTLKCPTRDIRISEHGNWRHMHWNAIVSAYRSTPFFEYYQDDFQPFYRKSFPFLFDFNEQLRNLICECLGIRSHVRYTSRFRKELQPDQTDFRETIHPKRNTGDTDGGFIAVPYHQVFHDKFGFIPDMSIIDLLFNLGPESLYILRDSRRFS